MKYLILSLMLIGCCKTEKKPEFKVNECYVEKYYKNSAKILEKGKYGVIYKVYDPYKSETRVVYSLFKTFQKIYKIADCKPLGLE